MVVEVITDAVSQDHVDGSPGLQDDIQWFIGVQGDGTPDFRLSLLLRTSDSPSIIRASDLSARPMVRGRISEVGAVYFALRLSFSNPHKDKPSAVKARFLIEADHQPAGGRRFCPQNEVVFGHLPLNGHSVSLHLFGRRRRHQRGSEKDLRSQHGYIIA